MRLVTYQHKNIRQQTPFLGVFLDDLVVGLDAVLTGQPSSADRAPARAFRSVEDALLAGALDEIADAVARFRARPESAATVREFGHPLEDLDLLPPVLRPTKVIGVGMNYLSFVAQLGEAVPLHPTLFHKTASSLNGHGRPVVIPDNTDQAVPEGELAVVIGRRAARISAAEANGHIAGYACANDISARDLEFQTSQWTGGKMLETFAPLGPFLVTPDEIEDVNELGLRTVLNGRVIQQGNTAGMVFSVQELISQISMRVPLEVGDVVLTGTPSDLGELEPPIFLTEGDSISVRIDGVGELTNPVTAAHMTARDQPPLIGLVN
ncbi:hypothetical protein GCM10023205_76910 [Yinghuangia aomiensis]|uniref:Fumarylacetoacetase-like C-terminal domain-containing protein n=1 Tax=Yinghuangia aomiensis TaxID=676205 RepID=A0ABP9IAD0_9ACTN